MNLQTNEDLEELDIDPPKLARNLNNRGLQYHRFPIVDESPEPLSEALPGTLQKLRKLVQAGHHVLIHCTGAINYSSTVAATYPRQYGGYSKKEVLCQLRRVHLDCVPYEQVLDSIWKEIESAK